MLSMNKPSQWVMVFTLCASLIISNASLVVAAENNEPDNGVISIDCGANEDYTDTTTNTHYQADSKFVQSGQNFNVSPSYTDSFDFVRPNRDQMITLRSFPDGMRNCYTLKPKQGSYKKYHINAYFAYGNYDNKNQTPSFDLYLGVNYWDTVSPSGPDYVFRTDVFYSTLTGIIDVCLIKTNGGVPFISLLELWPVGDSIYQSESIIPQPLGLMERTFFGLSQEDPRIIRYTDDIYGRSWFQRYEGISNSSIIKATAAIKVDGVVDDYKLPREVLSAAVQALNTSTSLDIYLDYEKRYEYYVYLHFYDFKERAATKTRMIEINFNSDDAITRQSLILEYGTPKTVFQLIKEEGIQNISIKSTNDSDLSAMLNALEIYEALRQLNSATQQQDVDAIREIKNVYKIPTISWQGDPCGPKNFTWEGITCSSSPDNSPRIISLNLSSNNLAGSIDASFSNLTNLEVLDLSNNELTGKVPTFLADLTKLKILNLTGNKLKGPIPEALILKSKDNSLQLRLDGNTGLYEIGSCKRTNKVIKLAASTAAASVAVIIIIVIIFSMIIHRRKRKNETVVESSYYKNAGPLKLKSHAFSYSEILNITDNLKTTVGEGGFGKVYLGILQDHTQVAVKLLSLSSSQGYKEFQSEAQLLTMVHHRNLVSLIGYCDEGEIRALIYEYMANGNLQQHLSETSPNILKWNERLNIAVDAAYGLDYLHNGCKPPIIHRDLKTSNILLDLNMKAKIADFGLSRTYVSDFDSHISTTRTAYTPGYIDLGLGNITKRSDIYSFGIILFELITGKPAIIRIAHENYTHILKWVIPIIESGDIQNIVDPRLQGEFNINSAWKAIEIALSCTSQTEAERPNISHILAELKECLPLEMVQRNVERSSTFEITALLSESEMSPSVR